MKKKLLTVLLVMAMTLAVCAVTATATTQEGLPAQCEHCKTDVTWTKLTTDDIRGGFPTETGHYCLDLDETLTEYNWMAHTKIPSGSQVCIYLNGQSLYGTINAFTVQDGGMLNIMDGTGEGMITGRGRSDGKATGSALTVDKGGVANLYGGILAKAYYSSRHVANGGVALINGEFNMFGGKIQDGTAGRENTTAGNGGNVYVGDGGVFTMKNGAISGGTAVRYDGSSGNGGNVYVADGGSFIMENGIIQGGTAQNAGGSIYVAPTGSFAMQNGSITGGEASVVGPCIYCRGNVTLSGGASIEELQLKPYVDKGGPALSEMLTIQGTYTGITKLRVDSPVTDMDVGNSDNAEISGATIGIYGSMMTVDVVGGNLITSMRALCQHCDEQVSWKALTEADAACGSLDGGHYYLAFAGESCKFDAMNIYLGQEVCLNLNGKQLEGTTRAFAVYPGGILSIMGDGTVLGHGCEGTKSSGGTIVVSNGAVLNLYSGTIAHEDIADDDLTIVNGGTLSIEGTFNMYGGKVAGGTATNAAGTIFGESTSILNFCGGSVAVGSAKAAPCIYNKGRIVLSGSASVAQVLLKVTSDTGAPGLADMLTVSGAYTGTTVLRGVSAGSDIGINDSADLSKANLTIYNSSTLGLVTWGADLIVTDGSKAMSADESGTLTPYATAQAAVAACEGTAGKVILFADVETLTVTKTVTVDLNGNNIGSLEIAEGAIVYCMDAATEDYDVTDGVYGKVKSVNGELKALEASSGSDGYLPIQEQDGVSFHRVDLKIKSMSLRPSDAGLYFISNFAGDHMVKARVQSFGVAMNTVEMPDASNMGTTSKFTVYPQEQFNSGAENTSSLVYNIMKSDLETDVNGERADIQIIGRAYIDLGDGNYLFGVAQKRSLQEQMELIDAQWDSLNYEKKSGIYSLYDNFKENMETWEIPNIAQGKADEDRYAQVEKEATAEDIAKLDSLYANTTAYYGELHDHSMSGPKGDGKQTLEVWKKYMDIIGMDFATLVDHRQAAHMYLDEWDDTMFIGGSEFATWITDYTHTVDAEGTLQNGVHYNMTFANRDAFVEFMKKIPEFDYSGEDPLTEIVPTYPKYTRARMTEIANTILDNGGFFTHVHPKSNMVSDNPLDYWFADWTGIEVIFTSRTGARNADNYKLWTDLLALGKKVYATAGSDLHNLPNPETMSTFYTTEKHSQAFLNNMRAGNFTAGMAGIRMTIGDTVMGSQAKENFAGQRLVFSVGDFHSSLKNGHDYRVDLISDEGIVFSQTISGEETTYFAVEAENCKFYRVEVHDITDDVLISMGQPIWNAE